MKKIYLLISLIIIPLMNFSVSATASNTRNYQVQMITLLKDNEKQLTILSARVKDLMDNYASLSQQVIQLKQDLSAEQQKNIQLKNEISTLKQQLSVQTQQIQNNMNKMVDKVASETSKAINAAIINNRATPKRNNTQKAKGPIDNGEFIEYKVQAGATLSAIAQAYGVSISSIREANNLKNDFIRIGQVLYIPKK